MSKIDLHIHSNCSSDGELTAARIVGLAKEKQMCLISITDHNSVRAIDPALNAAGGDLQVIPGVELDCTFERKGFHLLGYGFDYTRKEFGEIEADILSQERGAGEEKIRLFRTATGIPLDVTTILANAPGGVVTGEGIADWLFRCPGAREIDLLRPYLPGGDKSDMPNVHFYWDFFSEGKIAYVPIRYLSLSEAVKLIHSTGGIAVLAHPGQNLAGDDSLLPGIIAAGIDGIEAFSSYHTAETAAHYAAKAKAHGLMVTCGSDFHGKHKPHIALGGHGAPLDYFFPLQQ